MERFHAPTRLAAALLSVLLLCLAALSARSESSPNPGADWLQAAMQKEARKLKSKKVSVGEGFFKSRLAGKPMAEPQSMEGGWYLAHDIGTPSPFECYVFETSVDPATMALNIVNASIQSAERQNGPEASRSTHFLDAGTLGNAPYLALEVLYTLGHTPNKRLAGLAKVRIAALGESTLACAHNFLGYRETFAKAFAEFVNEADITSGAQPDYEEVIVQKIGSQPIGLSYTTISKDDEGDTAIVRMESLIIPVDNATLTTSDSWHSSFARPDGTLINQLTAKAENGQLTTHLTLEPTDRGNWLVSGTFQGKDISAEINGPVQPMSEVAQMRAVESLLADPKRERVSLLVWVPDADPTQFLEAGVELAPNGRKTGQATLTLGPLAIAAQFDEHGSLLNGQMQVGAAEMAMQRVSARGTLP